MDRLTERGAIYTTNDGEHDIIVKIDKDGREEPLYDLEDICRKINRLAELEDKIESGEFGNVKQFVTAFAEGFHKRCNDKLQNLVWEYGEGAGDVIRIFDKFIDEFDCKEGE